MMLLTVMENECMFVLVLFDGFFGDSIVLLINTCTQPHEDALFAYRTFIYCSGIFFQDHALNLFLEVVLFRTESLASISFKFIVVISLKKLLASDRTKIYRIVDGLPEIIRQMGPNRWTV